MAILSGDKWMQSALQEGQGDFFVYHLMPVLYPAQFPRGVVDVIALQASDPVKFKEMRTITKSVQYGLAFGRQAPAIAKAVGLTTREAQAMLNRYFERAPDFAQWRLDVMEAAVNPAKRELLVSPFGRRFHSEIVTPRNTANVQREALSFLPQSTSSDICLSTAIAIDPILESEGFKIFNIVHDAIMIRGPEDQAEVIAEYVMGSFRQVGEQVMGTAVPFLSDYSVGYSWSELD